MKYGKPGWKAFNVAVVAVLVAIPAWGLWKALGLIGLVLCIPIAAWFISRALVHGGEGLLSWLSTAPLAKWNGSYYQFNNEQIRVYEHRDRLLFVGEDVLRAAGITKATTAHMAVHAEEMSEIPGSRQRGFGIRQIERLANEYPGTDAGRLLLWAQREVVGPWEKKRERLP